jgi:hypothetical protein
VHCPRYRLPDPAAGANHQNALAIPLRSGDARGVAWLLVSPHCLFLSPRRRRQQEYRTSAARSTDLPLERRTSGHAHCAPRYVPRVVRSPGRRWDREAQDPCGPMPTLHQHGFLVPALAWPGRRRRCRRNAGPRAPRAAEPGALLLVEHVKF